MHCLAGFDASVVLHSPTRSGPGDQLPHSCDAGTCGQRKSVALLGMPSVQTRPMLCIGRQGRDHDTLGAIPSLHTMCQGRAVRAVGGVRAVSL